MAICCLMAAACQPIAESAATSTTTTSVVTTSMMATTTLTTLPPTTTTIPVATAHLAGTYEVTYTLGDITGADEAWLNEQGESDRVGHSRVHRWEITSDCFRNACGGLLDNYNTELDRSFAQTIVYERGYRIENPEPPFACHPGDPASGLYTFDTTFVFEPTDAQLIDEELTVTEFEGTRLETSLPDETAVAAGCPPVRFDWTITGIRTGNAPDALDWEIVDLADRIGVDLPGPETYGTDYTPYQEPKTPSRWSRSDDVAFTASGIPGLLDEDTVRVTVAAANMSAWNQSLSSPGYWMGTWSRGKAESHEEILAWYAHECDARQRFHVPVSGWIGLMDVFTGCPEGNVVINVSASATAGGRRLVILNFNAETVADLEALRVAIGTAAG